MKYRNNGSSATEWEAQEAQYSNPEALEWESEWESHESQYSNPYAQEAGFEALGESEWESHESQYSNPEALEWESEWESHESQYSNPEALEWEDEGELFFKKAFSAIKKVAGPLAKKLAPIAARTLVGMIPGVGAVAGPLAGKLVGALVREGEMEATEAEAHFFGTNEMQAEVGSGEAAHEAALMEVMAAEAARAPSAAQAAALTGAAVPLAMRSMRAGSLRAMMPILVRAQAQLVQFLHRQGRGGQAILPATATIMRRTIASLRAARQRQVQITPELALRVMAGHSQRVLGTQAAQVLMRNAAVRRATTGPAR